MRTVEQRLAPWLGFVGDLLAESLDRMPHQTIFEQLLTSISAVGVSYNWSQPDGRQGIVAPPGSIPRQYEDIFRAWRRGEAHVKHPLACWYVASGDMRPSTSARVPSTLVSARDRATVMQVLRAVEQEEQLSITYRLEGGLYQAYVLGRSGSDFTDDDLLVAREIQRLLIGVDHQITQLRRLARGGAVAPVDAGLTPREFAVLGSVAGGESTTVIARRLGCSPRTVNKHLEHVFRKLGVGDRINAIRVARLWGLTPQGPPEVGGRSVLVPERLQPEGV